MILAVDVGNTNIVLGGYEADNLTFSTRLRTDTKLEPDQYAMQLQGLFALYHIDAHAITGIILSSVVPQLTHTLEDAFFRICGVKAMLFSQELHTGVGIDIERPAELGHDLLAGAVGAKAKFALPAIVIDMGTATKITAIDKDGTVLGVAIAPGVFISLNALVSGASQLGGIAMQAPTRAIGRNTVDSMQSGIVLGASSMLDGMLDRFIAEMGDVQSIVATGGACMNIVPHCRREIVPCPTLILDGLYATYCKNV